MQLMKQPYTRKKSNDLMSHHHLYLFTMIRAINIHLLVWGETSQVEHVIDVPTNPVEVDNHELKEESVSDTPNQSEMKEAAGITQTECTNLEIEKAVEDQGTLEWKKECKGCCLATSIVAMVVGAAIVMPLLLLHFEP
ncbi:hypothetical protein PGT21_008571 [Puccinia graminis f. sp. tritici]|uniref:Transmembrane protein n=1 Tax=Puccinia graminis f. sp. tritici TaxID=56615 RepID=A0A5B0NJX1_PUCGR|nr:hypothetical protein PGTUg99_030508 [Puccinia graminis f. sp. tritici]KAA1105476.1 hypothetical protein PGT21_008571 [Puccinia graminis f. sp. tritici]